MAPSFIDRVKEKLKGSKPSDSVPKKKKEPQNPFRDGGGPGSETAAMGWSPGSYGSGENTGGKKDIRVEGTG